MPAFPAAALLCLYGDELVELDDWKSKGTALPGRDVKVKTAPLAAHLCAVALWDLERLGAVRLALEEKRRLGIRTRKVVVTPAGSPSLPPGIAQDLHAVVVRSGPKDVADVVRTYLEDDMDDPHGLVVSRAMRDGVPAGLLQDVDTGRSGLAAMVKGRTELAPNAAAQAEARAAMDELLAGWRDFSATRGELAAALVSKCRKAIDSRVETPEID